MLCVFVVLCDSVIKLNNEKGKKNYGLFTTFIRVVLIINMSLAKRITREIYTFGWLVVLGLTAL